MLRRLWYPTENDVLLSRLAIRLVLQLPCSSAVLSVILLAVSLAATATFLVGGSGVVSHIVHPCLNSRWQRRGTRGPHPRRSARHHRPSRPWLKCEELWRRYTRDANRRPKDRLLDIGCSRQRRKGTLLKWRHMVERAARQDVPADILQPPGFFVDIK